VGRGYAHLVATGAAPWRALAAGEEIEAHEFHHASLENAAPELVYAWRVTRGHGVDGERDGIVLGNLLASFCHLRGAGPRGWARALVEAARRRAARRPDALIEEGAA